jgi:hypothetical protein
VKRHAGAFTSILLRLVELWRCEHAASYLAGRARCSPETKKKDVVWFALNDDRPLFAFGGIWTEFRGDRGTKSKPIPGPHLVYGFLTGTERSGRADPPEGDAGDPDDRRGARRLDARAVG